MRHNLTKAFDSCGREFWTDNKVTVPVRMYGIKSGADGAEVLRCFWCKKKCDWQGVHSVCWREFKGQMLK